MDKTLVLFSRLVSSPFLPAPRFLSLNFFGGRRAPGKHPPGHFFVVVLIPLARSLLLAPHGVILLIFWCLFTLIFSFFFRFSG